FFNVKNKLLKGMDFRKDLTHLIQTLSRSKKYKSPFQSPINTLLPQGIMPPSYYDRETINLSDKEFTKKWSKHIVGKPLKLVLADKFLLPGFVNDLKHLLHKVGFNLNAINVDGATLVQHLKNE